MNIIFCLFIIIKIAIAHIVNKSEFGISTGVGTTMRDILKLCYKNYNASNPIFLLGDLDDFIDESLSSRRPVPVITMNDSLKIDDDGEEHLSYDFKPNIIVLVGDSPEELQSNLLSLSRTKWWNYMAHFFILGKNHNECKNFAETLNTTWEMNIIMSIFICSNSLNISELYTLNPITNYALAPWERVDSSTDLNIYRQQFNSSTSCRNLFYDKTIILNGYEIKGVISPYRQKRNKFKFEDEKEFDVKLFKAITKRLNASIIIKTEPLGDIPMQLVANGTVDLSLNMQFINWYPERPFLFSYLRSQIVAVRKIDGFVSTLKKIDNLWSMSIRILAFFTLSIFFLVLVHKNTDITSAILEIIRLLTYVSIRTNSNKLLFRIIFAMMLMLMIISNGVFQGAISAFLTKPQYSKGINTIKESKELNYTIYVLSGFGKHMKEEYLSNPVIEVPLEVCPEFLLNTSKAICITLKEDFYEHYPYDLPVTLLKEPVRTSFFNNKCRNDWPLHERVNNMFVRLVESGLLEYWFTEDNHIPMLKRRATDMGLLLPKYQPVKLKSLDFAFLLLAIGLSLATVVFIFEVIFKEFNI